MTFTINDSFSKCYSVNDFTFTGEILNGKLNFCAVEVQIIVKISETFMRHYQTSMMERFA